MVVTIIQEGGKNWFFRMLGPSADIDNEIRHFISFMHSLDFKEPPESTPVFEAPSHWEQLPATGMRFAAFQFGNESDPIELTVIPLGPEAGDLLANVNRWREQLHLPPITEAQLPESTMPVRLGDRDVTLVDLVSTGHHHSSRDDFAAADVDPHRMLHDDPHGFTDPVPITYEVPMGWTDRGATGMRQASLAVMQNDDIVVDVSVIPLAGDAGGTLANVNFWREQLGLEPIDEGQLDDLLMPITIDGDAQAIGVDMASETPDVETRDRTIAVIHPHGGQTWFIKMSGPFEIVGRHKGRFEQFVESIRFDEGEAP